MDWKAWHLFTDGLISEQELMDRLEALQIRGALRADGSFIGYDYAEQKWVDTNNPVRAYAELMLGSRNPNGRNKVMHYRLIDQMGLLIGPKFTRWLDAFNYRAMHNLRGARIVERAAE